MANFKVDENNNITRTSSGSKKGKATFSVSENGSIKRNKVEKKQSKGLFQSSKYFDDGYNFGDISKTFFWSGADLLQDVSRGFSRTIEGTVDTLGYLSADVLDVFGADDTADWLRDVSKYDVTGKLIKDSNYLEQRSVFGGLSDTVFEGVGNVGAMALTAGVTGGGTAATVFSSFSSAYGNTMGEALRNGEDINTARKAAFINGTAEAISEQFFDALPGMKVEGWGSKVVGKIGSGVEKYFGTNTGKIAMKILNASGEGFEEIISNMLTSAGNDLMHMVDKNFTYGMEGQTGNILEDLKRAATSKESWSAFLSASLTSALTNGGNQFISNTQKNKLIKSYAQENNMTVSQVKQAFNQSVQQKTQSEMLKKPNMNLGQRVEFENQAKAQTMSELKRGTFVKPGTETERYQYKETDNQKVNEMNKSLAEVGNNTQLNREAAATAERLIRDLGFEIEFTNNEKLQAENQNFKGKNINGFVKDGKMYLNIDSNELANFTIGHETKHFFEANQELNDALNQSLKEYAQEKGIWDKRLAEITDLYTDENGKLVGDPETELLADLTGEVFSNYEFVNNLSVKNPSLFEKVRDFFQKLYYKATGQREKLLIKNINDNLNRAYREYSKTQPKQEGTQYLLSYANTAKMTENQSQRLNKAIDMKYDHISDEEIWKKTGVLFDTDTAKLYVDDLKLKDNVENLIKNNKKIKLSELFDSKIFENYPQLKDYYFEVRNLEQDAINENLAQEDVDTYRLIKGSTTEDNGIVINSNLKSIDEMESVLSHEVQHLIQEINGDKTDSKKVLEEQGKEAYRKLPTELEAEVNRVLNNMTPEQRKNINPQSIKDEILKYYKETKFDKSLDVDKVINRLVNKHGIQYSLSVKEANTTQDNEGRELSKEQQKYFENSKIIDGEGNLITVYHTTTDLVKQFNEFNPVGTYGYKFGNQIVNYFTNSKDMSGSYAQYRYEEANTKKITNMNDVNELLGDRYELKEENGKYRLYDKQKNKIIDAANEVIKLFPSETQQMLKDTATLSHPETLEYLEKNNIDNDIFDIAKERYTKLIKQYLEGQLKVDYFSSTDLLIENTIRDYYKNNGFKEVKEFNNQNDLFKNITEETSNYKSRQYSGYLNITNPFVIDGGEKYWNGIITGSKDFKESFKNKWESRRNEKLFNNNIKDLKQDLNMLGFDLREDNYGDLGVFSGLTGEDELIIAETVDDVIDAIKLDLNNDEEVKMSTNSIVKYVLNLNSAGQNYDGVIIKNIYDYGFNTSDLQANDVYVTFNSNQFKAVDNTSPTEDADIRYSLSKNEDTYLDELSEQQMEYFKDTKAVDKQGYLDVVFHGTPKDFTVFDISQADNVALGNGLYFTTSEGNAKSYAKGTDGAEGKVLEGYVNIVNPASRTEKTLTFDNFKKLYNELNNNPEMYNEEMGMSNIDALLSDYGNVYEENIDNILRKFYDSYDNDVSLIDNLSYMDNAKEMYKTLRDVTGLDGIIAENPTGFDDKETYYIIFNPDQFKLKSNKTPTINEDMRYSISQEGEVQSDKYKDLFPGMTRSTTRLSDLKRKEVELPTEEENALKTAENEQKQGEKPTRREVIDRNRELAREQLGDITKIKDKKRGFLYQINTMKRNLRDIMSKEQAQKMYDTYFKNVTENNAKIENEINSYNERIQKYNLNDKESTYTQMVGELKYNPETTLTKEDVDNFYYKNANKIDQQKCEDAASEFRNIYDELIVKINDTLTDNGYKPIEYRKGYFPHFIEEKATSKLGKLAEKLGWKVQKGQLPTDIAGITDQFKPGKAWTSFSQQRTGDATDYNALKGLDNYLRGAMDIVYHTNDIQKLRALENEIRYQYSSKGIQEKIDNIYADDNLDMEEKNDAIANLTADMRGSGLGNFVTEIRNYTDNLANKKSFSDRSMEQAFGRDVYSIMNNINGRVSANMVGANISSAITNFIPITQAWGNMSTKNLLRGMYESIKTSIKGDNFADKSTFLTNRTKQADRLYNTKLQKINKKLGIPFEAIDSFTANTIVRGKYYDNIAKGMSEQEAIQNADEFAKDVMAGRSKGDQPTMFNKKNPLVKLFTAFQLEVNNQYGYMFKDIPTNLADEAKDKLIGAFIKMFFGAWLYNEITEKFTGRRAAFDPIDMAISDVKTLTDENMDLGDKIQSIVKDTSQELPFVSGIMGGGRLPIQGAIPYSDPLSMVTSTLEDIGKLDDPEKRKTAINNLKKEWSKPLYYVAMPFAGGQIKKTVEGLSMYDKDLPIAGSYTNSGKLRFEADTSTLGKIQSAVFGQYASKNAREYFEKGYSPLTEGQVQEALDAELPIKEYREINQGIKEAKAEAKKDGENQTEAMYDYIYDLPITMEQKNSLINSRTKGENTVKDKNGYIKYEDEKGKTYWYDKKNDTLYNSKYKVMDTKDISEMTKVSTKKDLSDYGKYGSLAEFNYSNKNPDKYLALTQITDYDTYNEYKDDISAIKQRLDNQPTEVKKQAVFEYINSLPLSIEQKLMLQKMAGGYSIKQYRSRMHDYINSLDLTAAEKQSIDDVLFK